MLKGHGGSHMCVAPAGEEGQDFGFSVFTSCCSCEPLVLSALSGWILKPVLCFQLQLALQGPDCFSLDERN